MYQETEHSMPLVLSYHLQCDVLFHSKKSQVIIYKTYNVKTPISCVTINDASVKCGDKVIQLCHLLTENVYKCNMSKCIEYFNHQCNIFLADFKYCSSHIRILSFQRYCTSFCGIQMLPYFDKYLPDVFTACRIAIHRDNQIR